MVKQKRNTNTSSEFTGFAAFASHQSSAAAAVQMSIAKGTKNASSQKQENKLKTSPIYAGNDSQLAQIFKRITKKDATTKSRALLELCNYAYPCDETGNTMTSALLKNEQVSVLSHFVFLLTNKLIHDNNSSVRKESLKVLGNAMVHVPKACNTLLRQDTSENSIGSIGNVIGWTYSFQSSRITEESKFASTVWNSLLKMLNRFQDDGDVDGYVKKCILLHAESILQSSSRPANLATALSVSKKANQQSARQKKGGKGNVQQSNKSKEADAGGPSESEKEDMEERFDRVVSLTLQALSSLFREYPEKDNDEFRYADIVGVTSVLWKQLSSPKGNFRRETYALLSCIFQNASSLIHGGEKSNLSSLLLNILSSERDLANFGSLFEMLLLFIASFRKFEGGIDLAWQSKESQVGCCKGMDAKTFVKSMSKVLKKACYGSSSIQWGPMILPILATLKSSDQQLQILTSLWNGRTSAVGASDSLAVVSAVAECSMYLLVQNDKSGALEETGEELVQVVATDTAQVFLDCLSYYLTTPSRGSASMSGEIELSSTLVRDLYKLGNLSTDRRNCKFVRVQDWFWNEGIASIFQDLNDTAIQRLRSLVDGMAKVKRNDDSLSFIKTITDLFWNKIIPSCDPIPNMHYLNLILSIFKCCSVKSIFESAVGERKSMESFAEDILVVWISQINDPLTNKQSLEIMFTLLFMMMTSMDSKVIKHIWECCLAVMLNRDGTLETIIIGMTVLVKRYKDLIDSVRCHTFDKYAIELANNSESCHKYCMRSGAFDKMRAQTELSFFRLSAGLEGSPAMVSSETIQNWLNIVLSTNVEYGIYKDKHILLDIIFLIARKDSSVISEDKILKAVELAWKEGGPSWDSVALKNIIASDTSVRSRLLSSFSDILSAEVGDIIPLAGSNLDIDSYLWAERASRALDIYHEHIGKDSSPLQFVGLGEIDLWFSAINDSESTGLCDSLYLCFMYLLQKYSSDLFVEAEADLILGLYIFMTFVTFDDKIKTVRCENLLILLGEEFKCSKIEVLVFKLIDMLSHHMKNESMTDFFIRRAVALLDLLVGHSVPKFVPHAEAVGVDDDIAQEDIKEGDKLWYIPDISNTESERLSVTVLKIHTDDFPNLYFSIELKEDHEESKTKQTVSARLKKLRQSPSLTKHIASSQTPSISTLRIEEDLILKLVKPFITASKDCLRLIAADILNCAVSHCGLQGKSGIGSTRFEAFQILSAIEQELNVALSAENVDSAFAGTRLQCLAIALGYGSTTVHSKYNGEIFKYDGESLINALKFSLGGDDSVLKDYAVNGSSIHHGLIMWLGASSRVTMSEENAAFLWEVMDSCMSSMIDKASSAQSLLLLEAVKDLRESMGPIAAATKTSTLVSTQACVTNLLNIFVQLDDTSSEMRHFGEYFMDDSLSSEQIDKPHWFRAFRAFIIQEIETDSGLVSHLGCNYAEDLVQCISSPLKQQIAFHILHVSVSRSGMLYTGEDIELDESTNEKLDLWLDGLDEEEANEIEDDVMISAQWLPHRLMFSLEAWTEQSLVHHDYHDHDEHAFVTRILEWLLSLEYLDAAGALDMRNRAHITSYIEKTGAIKEVFDIAMLFSNLEKQKEQDLFKCISVDADSDTFSLSELCTLAIFRSIESMPTLCKSWWNDECPRALQPEINAFVETMIAPETLKREMQRITNSADLGELNVSGSCVSREVTATYMQDECKLSVMIRVPPSFPLRNAVVDCQKTLGISDKRWRYWSLQIMQMLNNQDGSMLDALLLWKQNVDKEFEGVEPCPVCYSVLCVKTHAMPNLECNTCQNRFHSSCLYKWFNSSGKNQCVLCQQPWSGTKVL